MGMTFYGLVMALMRWADDSNLAKLRSAWPEVYDELRQRYNAPGGLLPGEAIPHRKAPTAPATEPDDNDEGVA